MKRKNILPYETVGRIMEQYCAERISHDAKVALAEYLEEHAIKIGKEALVYASHAGRVTIKAKDIHLACKNLR